MLLMFYTVLHLFLSQTNSFNIKREDKTEYNEVISISNETLTAIKSITTDQNYYLNLINNSRKVPNLKSNIFDKMLSNEMLSIKQHLYEKDPISSSVYLSFKNNVPTPTLEINQKWPIYERISVTSVKPKFDDASSYTSVDLSNDKQSYNEILYKDGNLDMEVENQNKIIEVRSFSVMPLHTESLSHVQQAKRQCTCMRNNHHTICSHRGIGAQTSTEKICTHTEHYSTIRPECTRTEAYSVSLTYFPYFVYPSFFLGITTEAFKTYYHPDVINDLKLPKHRKIKKPYIDEALFSDADEIKEIEDDENDQYDDDEYSESDKSDDDVSVNKCSKNKCTLNSKLYKINYDNSGTKDFDLAKKINNGYIKVIDNDKFVEGIVEDLKVYYSDAVIKDCYCSLSSLKSSKNMIIYLEEFASGRMPGVEAFSIFFTREAGIRDSLVMPTALMRTVGLRDHSHPLRLATLRYEHPRSDDDDVMMVLRCPTTFACQQNIISIFRAEDRVH
ncbi:uncharacterized protein LOC125065443 [Vanessa atalanta]|uniref:uncharacterized protein LOC125065443 n=1 Tax=Vanessa atalanta TaxID=42275 RepID=UPI001FCCD4EB|nr:uncharacterized protein LOC125065443 [Vanessa atalanta]